MVSYDVVMHTNISLTLQIYQYSEFDLGHVNGAAAQDYSPCRLIYFLH